MIYWFKANYNIVYKIVEVQLLTINKPIHLSFSWIKQGIKNSQKEAVWSWPEEDLNLTEVGRWTKKEEAK